MKISLILLFAFVLHTVSSSTIPKRGKPAAGRSRPANFDKAVNSLLAQMATVNGYTKFHRCHILPWQFLKSMVDMYTQKKVTKSVMTSFINDLAKIHKGAAYYSALTAAMKSTLASLTSKYKADAIQAVNSMDTRKLEKSVYNMPSNLYPGDPRNNMSIQDNIDAPKEATSSGGRSTDATTTAKNLFSKYKSYGLTKLNKPGDATMAKSSDKPPRDTTGDYVKL